MTMVSSEHIRELVDMILDSNPDQEFTVEGLSDAILERVGEYYSARQIYDSIKALDYEFHKYTRDVSTMPYYYQRLR